MNLNLWITPDSANLDAQSGGLIVYKQQPPLHWSTDQTNNMGRDFSALRSELEKGQVVRVPFKQNRMVMFTSNLWHETMPFKFKTQCALLGLGRSVTYAVENPAHTHSAPCCVLGVECLFCFTVACCVAGTSRVVSMSRFSLGCVTSRLRPRPRAQRPN